MGRGEFGRFGRGEVGSPMMWRANKATAPTCMLDTPLRDEDQEGRERENEEKNKIKPDAIHLCLCCHCCDFFISLGTPCNFKVFDFSKTKNKAVENITKHNLEYQNANFFCIHILFHDKNGILIILKGLATIIDMIYIVNENFQISRRVQLPLSL